MDVNNNKNLNGKLKKNERFKINVKFFINRVYRVFINVNFILDDIIFRS